MNDESSPGQGCDNQPVATPEAALTLRRRRLLKIGAGAAPAALLLVGRPVHAQSLSCNTASAWGSAGPVAVGSVKTRLEDAALPVDGWTLTDWKNNTTDSLARGLPWTTLFRDVSFDVAKTTKKVSEAGITIPTGLSGTSLLYDALTSGGPFYPYILVALLDEKLLGGVDTNRSKCLPASALQAMATGSYSPGPGIAPWDGTQIVRYLLNNGLVRT